MGYRKTDPGYWVAYSVLEIQIKAGLEKQNPEASTVVDGNVMIPGKTWGCRNLEGCHRTLFVCFISGIDV